MSNPTKIRAVRLSLKVYRRLLAAYPIDHRQEYGGPMKQLFRDQCRDAWNEARGWGLAKLWLRIIPDLLRTSILEHLVQLHRRKIMSNLINARSTPVWVLMAVFSAVFLLVFGSSLLITLMLPKSYSSTARIRVEQRSFSTNSEHSDRSIESVYDPYFIRTEFEIIQSEVILAPVIDKLKLQELWAQKYGGGQKLNRSDALQKLKRSMNLRPVRNTSIIEIKVYADAPAEAAQIANAVAGSFQNYRRNQLRQAANTNFSAVRGTVQIIDPALPNPRPVAPRWSLNIVLGFIFGVFLGSVTGAASAGFVFIRWRRRETENSLSLGTAGS